MDQLLGSLGYRGSFGEKLTAAGPRLRDVEALWRAHKLRNRLAHEPGVRIAEKEAQRAVREAVVGKVAAAHERAVTYQRSTTTIDRSDRSTHTNHITMPTTDPFTAIRLMDRRVRRKNR